MVDTAGAELGAHPVRGSKTEVRDGEAKPTVEAQDVLRLQVAMIDTDTMAILNCVKQLKENVFDEVVIAEIPAIVKDLGKEIAITAILQDDEGVIVVLDDPQELDNVRVAGHELMESDLAHV